MPIYNQHSIKIFVLGIATVMFLSSHSQLAQAASEDKIKTAIIFKMTKFISWPKKSHNLTICILGEGAMNNELNKINRKDTKGRRISITNKNVNAPFEKLCDALFIHNVDSTTVSSVINRLKGKPVLTISDTRSFVESGGMIGLNRRGKKIHFAINNSSATDSKITISSKLLKLAKDVK